MTILALVLASSALASDPPPYANVQPVRSVREAGQETIGAVNELLALNLIKETVPQAKAALDRLAQRARDAQSAARDLLAAGQPPLSELKALTKSAGSRASVERRAQDDAEALSQAADRLGALRRRKEDLDTRAERIEDPLRRAQAGQALREAAAELARSDSRVEEARAALKQIDEQKEPVRRAAGKTLDVQEELESAQALLSRRADSAQVTTGEAKAALDQLGDDNASKARAFDRAQAAEEDGKTVFNQTSILALRSDDFSSRYAALLSAAARFDAADKAFKEKLAAAAAALASAERVLEKTSEVVR